MIMLSLYLPSTLCPNTLSAPRESTQPSHSLLALPQQLQRSLLVSP